MGVWHAEVLGVGDGMEGSGSLLLRVPGAGKHISLLPPGARSPLQRPYEAPRFQKSNSTVLKHLLPSRQCLFIFS